MALVKLTARNIHNLPCTHPVRTDYNDQILSGFSLRVSASGVRTFALRYFRQGRLRRYTIGRTPPLSLADARDIARRLLADVTKGGDPEAEKIEQRRRVDRGTTFAALAEHFLNDNASRLRPNTLYQWRWILQSRIAPALGQLAPEEITRKQVRDFVRGIAEETPYLGNRTFELVRRVFTWAVSEDLLKASPCVGIQKPAVERARDRVLTSDEVARIWAELGECGPPGRAIQLLFFTGARKSEVLSMRWDEIDAAARLWRIPAIRMKGKEPHVLPLSSAAIQVLDALRFASGKTEWVFPSPGKGPVVTIARRLQQIRERSGVAFRLHDVRRTVATGLAALGTPSPVISSILGHQRPGPQATRVYDRYAPVREMRDALERWSAELVRLASSHSSAQPSVAPAV